MFDWVLRLILILVPFQLCSTLQNASNWHCLDSALEAPIDVVRLEAQHQASVNRWKCWNGSKWILWFSSCGLMLRLQLHVVHMAWQASTGILDMGPDLEVNLLACEQKQLKHGRKMLAVSGLYRSRRDTHSKIMQVWRDLWCWWCWCCW